MKKLIKNFLISTQDASAASSIREFTINGDIGSVFDLQITNEDGHYYSFEKGNFSAGEKISTTASTRGSIENSFEFHILNAASNIIVGMIVTGDGIVGETKVVGLKSHGNTNTTVVVMDKAHTIPDSTTVSFVAKKGLNEYEMTAGSYTGSVVLPTVTDNDNYVFLLTASHKDNTFLESIGPELDLTPSSSNYGEFLTTGFRNDLFKSITINQFTNTVATVNLASTVLSGASVDLSSFSFNVSKPRGFISENGVKTSFKWTVVCPTNLAIRKSLDLISEYFETNKTQTVNGAITSSRSVVLDSVDNLKVGMRITAVSSGSLVSNSYIQLIDRKNKTIVIGKNNSFADGITLTFTANGVSGPSAFGTNLVFQNLAIEIPDLAVTVNGATSDSTALTLDDASFIQGGTTTIIKGIGIDVDDTVTSIASRLQFTNSNGNYNGTTTVTHTADTRIVAGLAVSGAGIPSGATIASINSTTSFTLSVSTTGGLHDDETITFSSNTVTLSSAKTVEDGVALTVEGSSSTAIITGDVVLTKMGSLNFTTSLNLDQFLGIGVS